MIELRDDPSLYQISAWQIFWRNFLAGFSRALGSLLVTVVIIGLVSYLALRALWPQIMPLVTTMQDTLQSLQETNRTLQQTQNSLNSLNNAGAAGGSANGSAGTATPMTGGLTPATINQIYQQLQPK